ncbi:MAG: 16S rRNA (adenine(1518)-N(6)/adenine(1519)-N(6))-dimethyltransferase RsmA [Gemmatimonadota bacterium]|nr:16S rRNA (adenine(1518)-N(6)/adenine(1519)-N(6))-dimethyltransferase RsmA [Gemmatimonadota bacterium]
MSRAPAGMPPVRKSLGQHFLHDRNVLARIADALGLSREETVVEIGPGRGALTDLLSARAGRVVAIEIDRALAGLLRERYSGSNVTVIEGDVLDVELGVVAGGGYVLAGNVPYYITTPILFHAMRPPRPSRALYLVQREVAERMAAPPGGREYGALSVNVQALARVELLFHVPRSAFQPQPRVDSAVVRVTPREIPLVSPALESRFRPFVIAAFGLRRKQMRRVVRTVERMDVAGASQLLLACGIDGERRPETLSPEEFSALVAALESQ